MFYALALLWFMSKDGAMMTSCDTLASNQSEIQGEREVAVARSLPYRAVADDGCTPLPVARSRRGAVPTLAFFFGSPLAQPQNGSMDSDQLESSVSLGS